MVNPDELKKIIASFTGKELSDSDIMDYAYFLKGSEDAFDDEKKERIRSDLASIVLHNPGLAEKVAEARLVESKDAEQNYMSKMRQALILVRSLREDKLDLEKQLKGKIEQNQMIAERYKPKESVVQQVQETKPANTLFRKLGKPLTGLAISSALFIGGYFIGSYISGSNTEQSVSEWDSEAKEISRAEFLELLGLNSEDITELEPISRLDAYKIVKGLSLADILEKDNYFDLTKSGAVVNLTGDYVLPAGEYVLPGKIQIYAHNYKIKFLPGTVFRFENKAGLEIYNGNVHAVGDEKNKIQFLPAAGTSSARISMMCCSGSLEQCTIKNLKSMDDKPPFVMMGSKLSVKYCEFIENMGDLGGGCFIYDSNIDFVNCLFEKNKAQFGGGGIYLLNSSADFFNCSIRKNTASEGGAGVYSCGKKTVIVLDNCTIEDNAVLKKNRAGGGIFVNDNFLKIKQSQILNNTAEIGGAVCILTQEYCVLDDKCVIKGNSEPQLYDFGMGSFKYDPGILKD